MKSLQAALELKRQQRRKGGVQVTQAPDVEVEFEMPEIEGFEMDEEPEEAKDPLVLRKERLRSILSGQK